MVGGSKKVGWLAIYAAFILLTATLSHGRSLPQLHITPLKARPANESSKPDTVGGITKLISNGIWAFPENPEIFKNGTWMRVGPDVGNKRKLALPVTSGANPSYRVEAIGQWGDKYDGHGWTEFLHWRLTPIVNAPTDYLSSEQDPESLARQFYLVNDFQTTELGKIEQFERLVKWALSTSDTADGSSQMANARIKENLPYLRRVTVSPSTLGPDWGALEFIPDSVQNVNQSDIQFDAPVQRKPGFRINPGIEDSALFDPYLGLTTNDLTQTPAYAPEDRVFANLCVMRDGSESEVRQALVDGKLRPGRYRVMLSKGAPLPEFSRNEVSMKLELFGPAAREVTHYIYEPDRWKICSPATLQVQIRPLSE